MASVSQALPNLLRWVFSVLVVFAAFLALLACLLMLINPHIPPLAHFGPIHLNFAGAIPAIWIFIGCALLNSAHLFRGLAHYHETLMSEF